MAHQGAIIISVGLFFEIIVAWLMAHMGAIINSVGLFFDIVGAWFVAWEVVRQYKGPKTVLEHIPTRTIQSSIKPSASDHPDFKTYEATKYRRMKWGLGFLTIGFILQMLPNLYHIFCTQ